MTEQERKMGLGLLMAMAEAIRAAGGAGAPEGVLYAGLMEKCTLGAFASLVGQLVGTGLVVKRGNVLTWKGGA